MAVRRGHRVTVVFFELCVLLLDILEMKVVDQNLPQGLEVPTAILTVSQSCFRPSKSQQEAIFCLQ